MSGRRREPLSLGQQFGVLLILAFLALLCIFGVLFLIAACVSLLRFIGGAL